MFNSSLPSGGTRAKTALAIGAILSAAALGLTACSGGGSGTATNPPSTQTPAGDSGVSAAQDMLVPYVGGTAGAADASATPVKIGYITQEGAIPSFPESLVAAQASAKFVNDKLGGIKGHPVELVPCVVVSTQEEALACAQKMASDESIVAVQMSLLTVGTESVYSTLKDRKPVLGQTPASPTDVTTANVYQPWPGSFGVQGGIAKYVADTLHAKNAAVVYDADDPGSSFGAKTLAAAFDSLGVKYNSVGTQTGSADVASALVSAGAAEADVLVRVGSTPSCVPTANAIAQLGITTPVIGLDFCTDDSVRKANGGDLPAWTYVGQARSVFAPENDKEVAAYRAAIEAYAPGAKYSGLAPYAWDAVIIATKMFNQIGTEKVTPNGVAEWWRAFQGPLFMGPEQIQCGFLENKGLPGLCSTAVFFTTYEGKDVWKPSVMVDSKGLGLQ